MGSLLSMHSESAVVSITLSPRSIASMCVIAGISCASGFVAGIGVEHALHPVLAHQDRLGADLQRTQGRRGVRREERVAGASREDHDAALLQVPDRPPPDVRLGHLATRRSPTSPGCAHPASPASPGWSARSAASPACRRSRPSRGPSRGPPPGCRAACCRRRPRSPPRRPSTRTSSIAAAMAAIRSGSCPYGRSPISASPDSLSSTPTEGRGGLTPRPPRTARSA